MKTKTKKKSAEKSKAAPKTKGVKTPKKPKLASAKSAPKKQKVGELSTKTMAIYNALTRPDGATVAELAEITKWQQHSVRGFLSIKAKKDEKFTIEKFTRTRDGKTAYKIALPEDKANG